MERSPSRRRGDDENVSDAASFRVLIVDDDPHFRAWLDLLMRRLGLTVESVEDGEQALEALRSQHFDLLVSDFEMPKLNGIELIQQIRATPELAHQYAVVLTSHDDLETKISALTTGFDDFLTKGCTEIEVVAKVIAAKRMLARTQQLSDAAQVWQTLATRDELTGVATRRALMQEAQLALSAHRSIGVALLDLDDFKPVNDTFGHLTGDRILRDVGALFLRRSRASDVIGRYGGDEFVLLVRDLPVEDISVAAERLVAEIEKLQWSANGETVTIRVTTGIAHSALLPNATLEQLLEAADRDLYAKKWLKKHPGDRPELYSYPAREGAAVPLPPRTRARRKASGKP